VVWCGVVWCGVVWCGVVWWCRCFPNELGEYKIHSVIDFVHERVSNALEVVQREEKNKSLQTLFMELNDHTLNGFEFGKSFLAYVLYHSKAGGSNLVHSKVFDGSSFERGKLYRLLDKATSSVMKMYVTDMRESDRRIEGGHSRSISNPSHADEEAINHMQVAMFEGGPSASATLTGVAGSAGGGTESAYDSEYDIEISDYTRDSVISAVTFNVLVTDRQHAAKWALKKTYKDFIELHKKISSDFAATDKPLYLPSKYSGVFPKAEEIDEVARGLRLFLLQTLHDPEGLLPATKTALCSFLRVKSLSVPEQTRLVKAENVPNYFVDMRKDFETKLLLTADPQQGECDACLPACLPAVFSINA
jgi:hypothetical protein